MYGIVGFIKLLLRDEPISGWRLCDGSLVDVADYPQLFAKTQYRFGGAGDQFALPTMHLPGGFAFVRVHETPDEEAARLKGWTPRDMMSQVSPYAGEDEPEGWMECDGRLLNIRENYTLATLVGLSMEMPRMPLFFTQTNDATKSEANWQTQFLIGACADAQMTWRLELLFIDDKGAEQRLSDEFVVHRR